MVWCFLKQKLRKNCQYSIQDLRIRVPEYLDSIPLDFFAKVSAHCLRYMEWYRRGLHGQLLEHAMKKYKCHRPIDFPSTQVVRESLEASLKKRKLK